MSLLAPFFFAGALAVGLPILFHLIRRRPKSEVQFSSLMFLDPTPPRLTRRSRLDHLPLLIIRALALIMLAAAFARPFLRSASETQPQRPPKRTVVLIDTSASMQRSGLWQQAIASASEVIDELESEDRIAIVTFDRKPTTMLGLDQSGRLPIEGRKQTAGSIVAEIAPSWFGTDTANALAYAAEISVADGESELTADSLNADSIQTPSIGETRIVLISDMQSGSEVESLQSLVWPERVRVEVRRVKPADTTNAAAFVITDNPARDESQSQADAVKTDKVRVRVINAIDSTGEAFSLDWSATAPSAAETESQLSVPVQVPPGQTRIVPMESPGPGVTNLRIAGDANDFDNVRYISIDPPKEQTVAFVGDQAKSKREPREQLLYYLQRVPMSDDSRSVSVKEVTPQELASEPFAAELSPAEYPLIIVARSLETDSVATLKSYLDRGGRVLFVLDDPKSASDLGTTLGSMTGESIKVTEAAERDYHMWSRIDFSDPIFRPMSDPQFNDFTKVRFWSHRNVEGLDEQWKTVTQFDDGQIAMGRRTMGDGELMLATFGWQPSASQLALSTKFIPLISGWLGNSNAPSDRASISLGDTFPIPPTPTSTITTPDGETTSYSSDEDASVVDRPGIYTWTDGDDVRRIAVNLPESESQTDPIGEELLEQFGVLTGKPVNEEQAKATERQLRDRELETRQKIWQWMLVTALAMIGIETWWGGRLSRRQT
ncbi:MAG: BatA domain-containing protein [Rubripirellula sp.]